MAVLSKDEFFKMIETRVGDDGSDEALRFIEDVTDTYNDMAGRLEESGDWKAKYEENDSAWRKRYRERFFGAVEPGEGVDEPFTSAAEIKKDQEDDVKSDAESVTFEDLFKEREE